MAFCTNCGAQLDGPYCSKCGTPAGGRTAPAPAQSTGIDDNLAAALCYIPIVGLVFLLIEPFRKNREIRFHAWQSLLLCVAAIVVRIAMGLVWLVLHVLPFHLYRPWSALSSIVSLAILAGFIIMAVDAYQRKHIRLPVIGPIAESQAGPV
jgi:uncharacterized membrane protein